MIAIGNWTSDEQVISLSIDWKRLGMDPETTKIEIPQIDDLQEAEEADVKQLHLPGSKGIVLLVKR